MPDAACPNEACAGRPVFTSSRLWRGVAHLVANDLCYSRWKIPLARCPLCRGRFRVLPSELAPRKTFTPATIEFCMKQFLQKPKGYRSCTSKLKGQAPDFTTLYKWLTHLGEFTRDGGAQTHSMLLHSPSLSVHLACTQAYLSADAPALWLAILPDALLHPCQSDKRLEQLQGCARLFKLADKLLFDSLHAWDL